MEKKLLVRKSYKKYLASSSSMWLHLRFRVGRLSSRATDFSTYTKIGIEESCRKTAAL